MQNTELAAWLIGECEKRNLSWAEASRRAGISPNTISDAVNGTPIGSRRLVALAELFDTPPEAVFRMAGLLPPLPDDNDIQPQVRAKGRELIDLWQRLWEKDPIAAQELMDIALIQGKAFETAVNAALRRMEREENQNA